MKEVKAPDKVTQKMTRDGAVAENLATGEVTNISSREPETDFSPEEEPLAAAETAAESVTQAHRRRTMKKRTRAEAETVREDSQVRQRPSSRLQFTDEERADPALQKYIRRSDKAADKLDAAKEAIPTKKVLRTERTFDEASGKGKMRLHFEEVEKKPNGRLRQNPLSRPIQEIGLAAHNEVHKVEHENVGVEAGHKGEELAERGAAYAGSKTRAAIRHHRMKPWQMRISSTKRRSMTIRRWRPQTQYPGISKRSVSRGTMPKRYETRRKRRRTPPPPLKPPLSRRRRRQRKRSCSSRSTARSFCWWWGSAPASPCCSAGYPPVP